MKWLEFNDSTVKSFDVNTSLFSECFGGDAQNVDQQQMSDAWAFGGGSSKCAYLLVYEKVLKKYVTLDFNVEPVIA